MPTRRQVLAAAGAFAFRPGPGASAAPGPPGGLHRATLDLGHRGSRGGPVATLMDGTLLWATTEPEAPYLSRDMWSISRIALRRSLDGGRSWGDPLFPVRGTSAWSVLSHALRPTRAGTLLHVYVRYGGYDYEGGRPEKSLCEAFIERSDDGGRTWSGDRKLPTGERYIGDVLSMEQLRDGRLIYPFAFLSANQAQFQVSALYSDDDGAEWRRSTSTLEAGGSGFESGASEPTVAELPDGRLWMLIRAQTGFLWQSYSQDRGATWSPAAPSRMPSSNAPATMLRLRSGRIAVAWNNHVAGNYARQSLNLGITADGREFDCARELDGTDFPDNNFEPPLHATYPYLTEPSEGTIAVSYNRGHWMRHNRPAMALASVHWLAAREELIDFRDGRAGWRSVNPGPERRAAVERYVAAGDAAPGASLEIEQARGVDSTAGISRNIPLIRDGEVRVVLTVVKPEAWLLFGDTLLAPGAIDEACLRVRFGKDGKVRLAAGAPTPVSRDRRGTKYSYLRHAIGKEEEYPAAVAEGSRHTVSLRYTAATGRAAIRIRDGPVVELKTAPVLGLGWVGLAVSGGGVLRIRSVYAAA